MATNEERTAIDAFVTELIEMETKVREMTIATRDWRRKDIEELNKRARPCTNSIGHYLAELGHRMNGGL